MTPIRILLAGGACLAGTGACAQDVAILTPYLSSVATEAMVDAFTADAKGRGWSTNVVDTRGDFGQLAARMEDVTQAGVDALVLVSVDPAQVQDAVSAAAEAGIPVATIDGALVDGVALNVTSDNFELGANLSEFLFGQLGGEGRIVKFFHSAHPGVRQRELALDEALAANPGIEVIAEHYVQVPGPIDDARVAMEAMLSRHGDEIDAVWAAWDEPGIGAHLALDAMTPGSDVIVAGIDGNPQAVQLIEDCTEVVGTVSQDFEGMASAAADKLAPILDGAAGEPEDARVPSILVTRESLGVDCG